VPFNVVPVDARPPAVRQDEGGQDLDEGRLARAVRAEQAEDAAALDTEVEAVEGRRRPPVEGLADEVPETPENGIPLDQVFGEYGRGRVHGAAVKRLAAVRIGRKIRST
jgi:hypothetical protein